MGLRSAKQESGEPVSTSSSPPPSEEGRSFPPPSSGRAREGVVFPPAPMGGRVRVGRLSAANFSPPPLRGRVRVGGLSLMTIAALTLVSACMPASSSSPTTSQNGYMIRSLLSVPSSPLLGNRPAVEIEVFSAQGFPVRGELPILRIGERQFIVSRYPESGDTHSLIFTLPKEEFAALKNGDPVTLQYGQGEGVPRSQFGPLDKSRLDK